MRTTVYLTSSKFKKQTEVANIIKNTTKSGIVKLPARFGKTLTAFIASFNTKTTIFISPTELLKEQVKHEFHYNYDYNGTVFCFADKTKISFKTQHDLYQNYILFNDDFTYLLLIDEINLYCGDKGLEVIKNLQQLPNVQIIGLTGKVSSKESKLLNLPILYTMSEEEAVREKYIAPSREYLVPIMFNPLERSSYISYTEKIKENLQYFKEYTNLFPLFKTTLDVILACARGRTYEDKYRKPEYFCKIISERAGWKPTLDVRSDYWKDISINYHPTEIYKKAQTFAKAMDLRNNLMCKNTKKVSAVLEIIKRFPDETYMIYTENSVIAKMIFDSLKRSDVCLYASSIKHGKIKDKDGLPIKDDKGKPKLFSNGKLRTDAISGLNDGRYKILITPQSLETGFTEKKITGVIIVNGSTNSNAQYQRSNRAKTYVENKEAKIFNIYFDDFQYGNSLVTTRDKQKLLIRVGSFENFNVLNLSI